MAVELARAYVTLVPSFQGAQREIAQGLGDIGEQGGKSAGKKFGTSFRTILGGSFFGSLASDAVQGVARGIASSFKDAVDAVSRMNEIAAQTGAAIKATGGAAGVTADHIQELADSLQDMTATESESIQEGANLLLTFKNIKNGVGEGNDVFDQATTSLVDMARAMGSDPQNAAIQLGKALNDPIAGISALSRVGVSFTEDQKKVIQALVDTGDVAGAQKVILQELNSEFGGSGAAYAETYAGKIFILTDKFDGLKERLVTAVMPALTSFASVGITALDTFNGSPLFQSIVGKFVNLGTTATEKLGEAAAFVQTLSAPPEGESALSMIVSKLTEVSPLFAALSPVFSALAPVMPQIAAAFAEMGPSLSQLAIALVPLLPPLVQLALEILPPLVQAVKDLTPSITWLIDEALIPLGGFLAENIEGFAGLIAMIKPMTTGDIPALMTQVQNLGGRFGDTARMASDWGKSIGEATRNVGRFFIDMNVNVVRTVTALPGQVGRALAGLGGLLVSSGRALVQGFINGIVGMVGSVAAAARRVVSTVANFFPHSPAKEGPFSGSGWTAVKKSGEALLNQFTSGFGVDVAPALLGSVSAARFSPGAVSAGSGGLGGGLSTGDVHIYTTQPASRAFVQELQQQAFVLGMG